MHPVWYIHLLCIYFVNMYIIIMIPVLNLTKQTIMIVVIEYFTRTWERNSRVHRDILLYFHYENYVNTNVLIP